MAPSDNRQEILNMFRKYLEGTATPKEKQFIETWYNSFENESGILDERSDNELRLLEQRMEQALRQQIDISETRTSEKKRPQILTLRRIAAAAVTVFCLVGSWYYLSKTPSLSTDQATVLPDLPAGADRAILTLSDGSQIMLDDVSNGIVAQQGNTLIRKINEGFVSYTAAQNTASDAVNTITAPAGGRFSVELSDGSRIWLNAESSVTFPTSFPPGERLVNITGEAYFEVNRDSRRPFIVQVGNKQKIKVLGTHFNVNAYRDEEAITTTLLEGSVEVMAEAGNLRPVMLKPGEQASLSGTGKIFIKDNINTEEIIAWKNGLFHFDKTDIETIMRQFSRWYNVEVVYEGTIPNQTFSGKIGRQVNASEALEILKFAGLNFHVEALPEEKKKGRITVLTDE